jgi:hypothetical protein
MIDILGVLAAVLACVLVTQEYGTPRQRNGSSIRNVDKTSQPHDRRHMEGI